MLTLYVGTSNVIEYQNLTNTVTGAPDLGATVTVTLTTAAGVNVAGDTWPKSMPHVVADTTGLYRAVLAPGIAIQAGKRYYALVDVTGSGAEKDYRRVEVLAAYRDD